MAPAYLNLTRVERQRATRSFADTTLLSLFHGFWLKLHLIFVIFSQHLTSGWTLQWVFLAGFLRNSPCKWSWSAPELCNRLIKGTRSWKDRQTLFDHPANMMQDTQWLITDLSKAECLAFWYTFRLWYKKICKSTCQNHLLRIVCIHRLVPLKGYW